MAVDPHDHAHVYLGTATGWVYESRNEGQEWKRLARVGKRDDLILDDIVIDTANPKHLVVGAHAVEQADGDLYDSKDGGLTWTSAPSMRGQSIRALAQSASDSKVWVAGTLTGVQLSEDNAEHWHLISPSGSTEIHEVESVAIDPANPKLIYAGTWHLPWKTTDGGTSWHSIKEGVIDDSDVFSIIIDPVHPNTVYASACSGIYKSDNAGGRFQKVEGIPSTARRTRVLMQDPKNLDTVFAGTTEGLWRTGDAGKIWLRMTSPDVIVNDVYVDPTNSNKVLLATDRGGVLASDDGGASFHSSNAGFSARHLSSYVADAGHPATVYVGALNDKQLGGVFMSENGGITWMQESGGLAGSDVFSLGQAPDGTVLAGTGHGLYLLKNGSWGQVADARFSKTGEAEKPNPATKGVRPAASKRPVARRGAAVEKAFSGAVFALDVNGNSVYAATSEGLLTSATSGTSWRNVPGAGTEALYFLGSGRSVILAAGLRSMVLSKDGGTSWKPVAAPGQLAQITAVAVDGDGGLWAGGREGVYVSEDNGSSWQSLPGLVVNDVNSIFYDARGQRMLITSAGKSTIAFAVHLPDHKIRFWDTGWNLRFMRPIGDHLLAVTPFDGVVIEPRMVDSSESAHP
ncbi:WD40/YVTN/BNR-like repeat-containing protein [Granulicella arctica]|uniref:Photosystem II stability/assembly factor-like uncharacterized protein n=1 Tax=Granulicella arctica TaxID=940613 RepID=A0A7Y9TUK3_9BACT|nr:hypothetical protein [Granulicella arctica]NYF80953.1 photosystem II stability/assembly factor-like uncharacterized protein [Granulicella arctica]